MFRSYDKFSVGKPAMKIEFEGAGGAYQSYMGALLSLLFVLISAAFLSSKAFILHS